MNERNGKVAPIASGNRETGGVIAFLYGCLVWLICRLRPSTNSANSTGSSSQRKAAVTDLYADSPLPSEPSGNSVGNLLDRQTLSSSTNDINSGTSYRSSSPTSTSIIDNAIETQAANLHPTQSSSLFLSSSPPDASPTISFNHSSSIAQNEQQQQQASDSDFAQPPQQHQCWPKSQRFNLFKDLARLVQLEQETGKTFEHLIANQEQADLSLTPLQPSWQPQPPFTIQQFPPLSPNEYYHTNGQQVNDPSNLDQAYLSEDYIAETNREVYRIMSMPGTVPPTPPPMPGALGSIPVPNWRAHPFPVRESAPSKQQIDKEQYAHLPDKLMNAMNKDKKPFTYTPEGIGERGVLNLDEIRSPRMKRRLMANLNDNEEEENDEQAYINQQQPVQPKAPANLFQQPMAPFVLPPLQSDSNRLHPNNNRSTSPLPGGPNSNKKEVRFAPSPIMLASDDEELASVLQRRKQDVESRSTIATNDPIPEPNVTVNGFANQMNNNNNVQQISQQPPQHPTQNQQQQQAYQPPSYKMFDAHQLVRQASDTVNMARQLFPSPTPNLSAAVTSVLDGNNNFVVNQNQEQQNTNNVQVSAQLGQANISSDKFEQDASAVNEMINQIENDLSEIRLKERTPQAQQPQQPQEQPTLPEIVEPGQIKIVNQANTYSGIYSPVRAPAPPSAPQSQPQQSPQPPQQQPNYYNSQPAAAPLAQAAPTAAYATPPPPPPPPHRQTQPIQLQQQQPPIQESDILKHVLDDGLQDEIDKFESSLETARSPTPISTRPTEPCRPMSTNYGYDSDAQNQPFYRQAQPAPQMNSRKPAPPPVPPKPQRRDGRTSCPPEYQQYKSIHTENFGQNSNAMQDNSNNNSFANSFRCISPSIEILKKSQASGYNYNPKPRPFCRPSSESGHQGYGGSADYASPQPAFTSAFKPFGGHQQQQQPQQLNQAGERIVPIQFANNNGAHSRQQSIEDYDVTRMAPGCSQTLPRKIKINNELGQPKTYDNRESGREYLPSLGMFSQLPPQPVGNDPNVPTTPTTPTTPTNNNINNNQGFSSGGGVKNLRKMFYGTQTSQTLPRKIKIRTSSQQSNSFGQQQNSELAQPKSYDDKESGREYLPNIGMYSQLPPGSYSHQSGQSEAGVHSNGYSNDQYGGVSNRRPGSLPPPVNRHQSPVKPSNPPPPPPIQTIQQQQAQDQFKPKLTPSQIRRLPPSQRPPEPNPSKYTGAHIPSRSFRLLQLITGEDIENHYAESPAVQAQSMPARPQSSAGYLNQSMQPNRPASAMAYQSPNINHNADNSQQRQAPPPPPQPAPVAPSFDSSDYGTDF